MIGSLLPMSALFLFRTCTVYSFVYPRSSSFSRHNNNICSFRFYRPRQSSSTRLSLPPKHSAAPLPLSSNRIETTSMPRGVKKENLPSKMCVVCGRPFTWRKKWERVWDEVTTCSKSCNRKRKNDRSRGSNNDDAKEATFDGGELDLLEMRLDDVNSNDTPSTDADDDAGGKADESGDENIAFSTEEASRAVASDVLQNQSDEESSSQSSSSAPNNSLIDKQQQSASTLDARAKRKAEKKRKKAERRAQREGRGDPTAGQKQCTMCNKSVNLLIRCTYDESGEWGMVCGKCWKDVSGGVVDGDDAHPHYRSEGCGKIAVRKRDEKWQRKPRQRLLPQISAELS